MRWFLILFVFLTNVSRSVAQEPSVIANCILDLHDVATSDLSGADTIRPVEAPDRQIFIGSRTQGLMIKYYVADDRFSGLMYKHGYFARWYPNNDLFERIKRNRSELIRLRTTTVSMPDTCIRVGKKSLEFVPSEDCKNVAVSEMSLLTLKSLPEIVYAAHKMAQVDELLVQMDSAHKLVPLWPEIRSLPLHRAHQTIHQTRERIELFRATAKECAQKITLSDLSNAYSNVAQRLESVLSLRIKEADEAQ